jgi:hypothetical protein
MPNLFLFVLGVAAGLVDASASTRPRIGLVEWHDHVLVHMMNATKRGVFPSEGGVTLIHFDSHADMALPKLFDAREEWATFEDEPSHILEATDINDWVTASWMLGVVDRMVFVEPPWGGEFVPLLPAYRSLVFLSLPYITPPPPPAPPVHRSLVYSVGKIATACSSWKCGPRTARW